MKSENNLYNTLLVDTIKTPLFNVNSRTESLSHPSIPEYYDTDKRITRKIKVKKKGGNPYAFYRRTSQSKDGINPGRKMLEKIKKYYNRRTWGGTCASYRLYPNRDIDRKALDDLLSELNGYGNNAVYKKETDT